MSTTSTRPSVRPATRRQRGRPSWFALIVTLVLLVPLVVVVGMSVNPGSFSVFPPQGFSLHWFQSAWDNISFRQAFMLSVEIAVLVACIGLLISVPTALAVVRAAPRVGRFAQALTLGPLVVPEVLLGLGVLILVNTALGTGSSGAWTIVLGHVLVGIPLAVQVMIAGLAGISQDVERAAWTLGASKIKAFTLVGLPLALPAIASSGVFLFIFSFDNVSMSLFLSKPGTTTLPIYMYQYLEYRADPTVAAMSTILVLIGVVAALIVSRLGGLTQIAGGSKK